MRTSALQLIEENKRTKEPFLDLGHCSLKNELPEELLDCVWLKELNLGWGYIRYEPYESVDIVNNGELNKFHGSGLSVLEKLPQLESLYINDSSIQDISSLQNLIQLQYLGLFRNQIKDISPLKNLAQIQHLLLSENQIEDISSIQNMKQLTGLFLSWNNIKDIRHIPQIIRLPQLTYISLNNNPLDIHLLNLDELKAFFNNSEN